MPAAIYIEMQFKNTHVTISFQAKLTHRWLAHMRCIVCDIQLEDALPHGPELSAFETSVYVDR